MTKDQNGFVFLEEEKDATYSWPVKITKPGSDKTSLVTMEFYHTGMEALKAMQEAAEDDDEMLNLATRIVAGWPQEGDKTFKDGTGAPIPVTDENKAKIFDRLYISRQTVEAFFTSQGGKKRKGSN